MSDDNAKLFKRLSALAKVGNDIIDPSGLGKIDSVSDSINLNINRIFDKNRLGAGQTISSLLYNDSKKQNKVKRPTLSNNTLVKLTDLVNKNGQFAGLVNDIFFAESKSFSLFQDYETIATLIPELGIILETYYENVISPDSVTNSNLHVNYTDTDEQYASQVIKELRENVIEQNKLDTKISKAVKEALKLGSSYIGILNFTDAVHMATSNNGILKENEEYDSGTNHIMEAFKESTDFGSAATQSSILNESYDEITALYEMTYSMEDNKATNAEMKAREDEKKKMAKELGLLSKEMFKMQSLSDFAKDKQPRKSNGSNKTEIFNDIHVFNIDPSKIIPIRSETEDVLGYFYVEYDLNNAIGKYKSNSKSAVGNINTSTLINSTVSSSAIASEDMVDAKKRIISEVFTKIIGKKIDSEFIAQNYQFKDLLYGILKNNDNVKRQYKITFLPPECVVEYGKDMDSVFKNILFMSKMYLACALSNFMQRIVQSPEKRIYYVDVGLDTDIPGAVASFAKSIKAQQFKVDHLNDITTTFSKIGTNQDMFIPTQNGEKPIDTEVMPSKEIGYQDEFLDFLKNSIVSGSGIPSAYLGIREDVDFARSLSMNSARFVRKLMTWNKCFNSATMELIEKCIQQRNKYAGSTETKSNSSDEIEAKDKDGNTRSLTSEEIIDQIDWDNLFVGYPKPNTLMLGLYSDKIANVQTFATFIASAYYGSEKTDDPEYNAFKLEVTKEQMPDIEWDKYAVMLQGVKDKAKKDKITKGSEVGADGTEADADGTTWE